MSVYTSSLALSIKSHEADRLARALAAETGETLTEAIVNALSERLARERSRRGAGLRGRLKQLAADVSRMPIADARSPEELVGYDDVGLPR
jgi:antitoxin VapB